MAFTDFKPLDFSGIDKALEGYQQRQSLSKLGQGLDGSPEGYAKAAQALLQKGDVNAAVNFFALGEKARERTGQATASKDFLGALSGMGVAPVSPVSPRVEPMAGIGQPAGRGGFTPTPTVANSEAEVQALEGSTGTPGQQVAARLVNNGLTPTAAAGVASNLNTESRFRTNAVNPGDGRDGSDSVGMAQWNGPRAQALKQFAAEQGKPWTDPNVQADFIAYELRTTEGRAGSAIANAQTPQQAGAAAIGYFRPQGYTAGNPMGALHADQRAGGANQFVLGGQPAPPSDRFTPQAPQVAQAPQEAPPTSGAQGGAGVYSNTPTPALQAFIANPKVPDNLRGLMQQELDGRQQQAPQAQPQPVQMAEAAPQQGVPLADAAAPGASPVTGPATTQAAGAQGFAIPGTSLPLNDPHPKVPNSVFTRALLNPAMPADQKAYAQRVLDARQRYSDENAPDKREALLLQNERARLEIEKARRESGGKQFRTLTSAERAEAGVDPAYKGVVQVDRDNQLHFPGKAGTEVTLKNEGTIPAGTRAIRDAQGNVERLEAIPGSEAAKDAAGAEKKAAQQKAMLSQTGLSVFSALDDIDRSSAGSRFPVAGGMAGMLANIPGTAAHNVANSLNTVKANISFERLNQMRQASPTGGALGAVSDSEQRLLSGSMAALEQSQDKAQFERNLKRTRAAFERVVHGKVLSTEERAAEVKARQDEVEGEIAPKGNAPPKRGELVDGYRYKGGDPANADSWHRVK